jgi:hypothetical protein
VSLPFLSGADKEKVSGVLVVPALAVEAQQPSGKAANLAAVLPNSVPLWYWFGQLFVPGFVGDPTEKTVNIARNVATRHGVDEHAAVDVPFSVRFSIEIGLGNG